MIVLGEAHGKLEKQQLSENVKLVTTSPLQSSCIFFIDAKEDTEVFWKYFCLLERCICGVITTVLLPSLCSKVLFLFSCFLACSWPQHFVKDFSAPRETTYFHPSYPQGKLWLHPGNWSSVSIQWSKNLPRTCLAPDLASDLKSHMSQLLHAFLGL